MKKALLVIDAQNVYTDEQSEMFCQKSDKTIANINGLIQHFRDTDSIVIFIRHVHKPDGSDAGHLFDFEGSGEQEEIGFIEGSAAVELDERIKSKSWDISIEKTRYSAFVKTDLEGILHTAQIGKVVICGFMTNFCCESTGRHAFDLDFLVDFIPDATGTPGTDDYSQEEIRKIVGNLLGAGFARVIPTTKQYLKQGD